MVFVDGENLVFRYEDMVAQGRTPLSGVQLDHHPSVFVWRGGGVPLPEGMWFDVIRTSFYTSAVGSDEAITAIEEHLKQLYSRIASNSNPVQRLHPIVFKKLNASKKSRSVDVRIVQDILTHVYQNNVDIVMLMSGDGDFAPVLREVIARGKQVFVAAFSSGLAPSLRRTADLFFSLDDHYLQRLSPP